MNQLTSRVRKITTASMAVLFVALCVTPIIRLPQTVEAAAGGATVQFVVRVQGANAASAPPRSVVLIVPSGANTNDIDMGDCASDNRLLLVSPDDPLTCHNMVFKNLNPNFASVEVAESPGYPWSYSIGANNTNGTITQEKFGRPIMNFSSGSATIYINLTPGSGDVQFGPPSLSATLVSDSSITLSWTPGDFPKDSPYWYTVYSNSKKIARTIKDKSTTATFDGLQPCTVYRMMVNSSGGGSNIATVRTTGCAAPTPTASNSSGGSSTPGRSSGSGGSSSSASSNGGAYDWGGDSYYDAISGNGTVDASDGLVNNADQADPSKPPAMPGYFRALGTKGNSAVSLGWATSYGKSKVHYKLERTSDKKTWTVLRDDIVSNAFNDFTAEFGALYYYRLTAIDENNLYSPSVVVSYNADDFNPNVGNGKKLKLSSQDKFLSFSIPASAVSMASNCFFAEAAPGLPLVGGKDQKVIGGPYKVVCQQKDGSIAAAFNQPVTVTAELSDAMAQKYGKVHFEAYSASTRTWKPITSADTKGRTVAFDSDDMTLVALAEPKGTPVWVTVLLVTLLSGTFVVSGALGVRSGMRILARRKAVAAEEDYWHKQSGV